PQPSTSTTTPTSMTAPPWPRFSYSEYFPGVKCVVARTIDEANDLLSGWEPCALGLDVEWRPNYRKGEPPNMVALVQLATSECVALIHLSCMWKKDRFGRRTVHVPSELTRILEDRNFSKLGVGIQDDAKRLYEDYNLDVKSCIDLSALAKLVDSTWSSQSNIRVIGLARLAQEYLSLQLVKDKTSRSNWEKVLTQRQIEYAANDAAVAVAIYSKLDLLLNAL
ncbi:ribonuclease H-like protein, partial [Sistotremastrum niveocremeum HHB9708]